MTTIPAYDQRVPKRQATLYDRLRDKRVCVCVGAGGVGKTTISAALALGLAARGRRVVVVSIDPARRLATAMGLDELAGEPHRIDEQQLAEQGIELRGELWAMMLDSKATFDGLIGRLAPDEATREEVLQNRIYGELSGAQAGSQEFTAVAKLFELAQDERFDMVVLDTPPSRNALDFLDAPERLRGFLEGRALRMLMPGGARGRALGLLGRGTGVIMALITKATGVNMVGELRSFFGALASLVDGLSERARGVESLLRDQATSFVIVTSPEQEPTAEATFFHERLRAADMPFEALIVNRVQEQGLEGRTKEQVKRALAAALGDEALAGKLAANLADHDVLARRDAQAIERMSEAMGEPRTVRVAQLDGEIQDLNGLARIAERIGAGG